MTRVKVASVQSGLQPARIFCTTPFKGIPAMGKSDSRLEFQLMRFCFKIRDLLLPRIDVLNEVGIEPARTVLDYGCGSGSYLLPLSTLIGASGRIFALDINSLAIQAVAATAAKNGLKNVETIHSNCATGLPDQSVDFVLLYDTYHDLDNPEEVLQEIHRILKPEGILSFSDHHMKDDDIREQMTRLKLFKLLRKHKKTYSLSKSGQLF